MDPAMQNNAYLILWINQTTGMISDAQIASEESPTVMGPLRPMAIRTVSGVYGYERASRNLLHTVKSDPSLSWLLRFRGIKRHLRTDEASRGFARRAHG